MLLICHASDFIGNDQFEKVYVSARMTKIVIYEQCYQLVHDIRLCEKKATYTRQNRLESSESKTFGCTITLIQLQ